MLAVRASRWNRLETSSKKVDAILLRQTTELVDDAKNLCSTDDTDADTFCRRARVIGTVQIPFSLSYSPTETVYSSYWTTVGLKKRTSSRQ